MSKRAILRVCAACEWVFSGVHGVTCPKCQFGSYGAHRVYGSKAYSYLKTQERWKEKKLFSYSSFLDQIIKRQNETV